MAPPQHQARAGADHEVSAGQHKSLTLRIKSAGDPSDDQMGRIRGYTLAELPADQLYVRTFALAHNAIDRDDEAFDDAALSDFARTLPGKGLFLKHPMSWDGDTGPGKGRWFEAELQRMSLDEARTLLREPTLQWPPGVNTATVLMAGAYLVRTPGNADMLAEIDAGIVSDVSIGFNAKRGDYFRDEQGREMQARRLTSPAEALEGSLVWLGAQPGARAIKGASRNEETDMLTQQELDAANTKATDFENKFKAAEPSHNIVLKAREALGDSAHLLDSPEQLGDAVKAANAYRDSLIDGIVASERALGLCGDDDEAMKTAKAIYAGDRLERLQQLAKHYSERTAKGGRVVPSNPGAPESRGTDTDTKGVPAIFAAAQMN